MSASRGAPDARFLASLASIALIGPLAVHLFLPVLPEVQKAFNMSSALTGATFSVTLLMVACSTLVYGSLSDRYGRRPVLLSGLALFVLGSALSAIAGSPLALILGRILQAIGAGAPASLSRAIASDAYGPERLVKVLAYLTMAYTLGPMLSPSIGGALIDMFGWRSTFWFALIVGAVIALGAWRVLYETRPPVRAAPSGSGLFRGYATLLRQPRFCGFVLQTGFSTATFMATATAASFLMQNYLDRPASEFGLYFMLFPIGLFLGNFVASRLSGRVAVEIMVLSGSVLMACAIAVQAALMLSGIIAPLVIFIPGFVLTFAQGIALPNAQSGAMRLAKTASGTAAGLGVFCQAFLGAVGAQTYAFLADGTPIPMVITVTACALLTLLAGTIPFVLRPS
ncbi:MAG: multidrug effflux MFS transporter [Burkholderiales bacterium]